MFEDKCKNKGEVGAFLGPNMLGGWGWGTTLNMIFSFTYDLELRNPIIVYYTSHVLPSKIELIVWTL